MSTTDRRIVVLNTGSSSLKFAVYPTATEAPPLLSGSVEGIGGSARLKIIDADGKTTHADTLTAADPHAAMAALAELPDGPLSPGQASAGIAAFGHRIVHGGPDLTHSVLVDDPVLARIEAISPLAPLHNPPALDVLKGLRRRFPGVPQVACFDTAFHRGHPAVADRFAIPDYLYQDGARRYGFHGLSYTYIAEAMKTQAPDIAHGKVVAAHLGSGASMCGLVNGRSVDSSMGFTALDGLPMATRAGSLDAGVILWLQQQKSWPVDRIEQFLYHECGLKGLSGLSGDIRELLTSNDRLAKLAVDYFIYHIARTAGALAVSMGGIDGIIFTAGIGEHSVPIRAKVLQRLAWLGFELEEAANAQGNGRITTTASRLAAFVIPRMRNASLLGKRSHFCRRNNSIILEPHASQPPLARLCHQPSSTYSPPHRRTRHRHECWKCSSAPNPAAPQPADTSGTRPGCWRHSAPAVPLSAPRTTEPRAGTRFHPPAPPVPG